MPIKRTELLVTQGKCDFLTQLVRLFHTSTPLRSVELSKEKGSWMGGGGGGGGGESATISLICQTIPNFHTSEKCRTK